MAASKPPDPNPPPQCRRPADAVERLYVYWIASTALLLLAVIVAIVYTRGALHSQATEYNRSLSQLVQRVDALQDLVAQLQRAAPPAGTGGTAAIPAQPVQPSADDEPQPGGSGEAPTEAPPADTTTAPDTGAAADQPAEDETVRAAPAESEIQALLDRALKRGTAAPHVVADPRATQEALGLALKHVATDKWSGPTWARLAVLARLMSRNAAAEAFARRAFKSGDPLIAYAEVSARALLAAGRAPEAEMHAEHFAAQTDSPTARLLLAQVYLASERPAHADELLATIDDYAALSERDKLAAARVCLALRHWKRLADVMATVQAVPQKLDAERGFLQAVSLIQQNERLVEALSILDYLADRGPEASASPKESAELPDLILTPCPSAYEIATWRGVAYMHGQQVESARQAFDHAAGLQPGRPEAYYWRAMLEIREGQYEIAKMHLQNALATAAGFAPAWETLGLLALNAAELDAAFEYLDKAIEANNRQASAHFLLAIAYAKASQREPAAETLTTTFWLDPAYVNNAAQTEVLARLFTQEELQALAAAAADLPGPAGEGP